MSFKRVLLTSTVPVIPVEPKKPEEPKGPDIVTTADGSTMQPGDVVKVKQIDKTKSPYSVVTGLNHETKQVELMNFGDTGVGNRAARRAKFAKENR